MRDPNGMLRDQLLTAKIIEPKRLEEFESLAVEQSTDLETILRTKRVLSDAQIHSLKGLRLGYPFCDISDFLPRVDNAEIIPEDLARRHVMFPLFDFDDLITLVMEDPSDLTGVDQTRRLTKKEVDVVLGSRKDILGLIERAYGASKYLQTSSLADRLMEVTFDEEVDDESQPVIRLVNDLIDESIRQGASDIHIEPTESSLRVRIRVDGVLREIAAPPLGMHRALVSRIKVLARLDISQTRAPQDGAISHICDSAEAILRVAVLPSIFGEAVVIRILRNESDAITLGELGMDPKTLDRFQKLVTNAHGMILVSGPTGSGKSTTLYGAMKLIASPQKNIIAIEDPVEYRTSAIRQVQVNPEANLTFATGLRSMLRQDPDVIMVGEIRDRETAQISVQAALTGHLLLSTVHTNDSVSAVARFRDLGIAEYLISSSLLAVLAQRLCRRICPECQAPDSPPAHFLRALGLEPAALEFEPMKGKGCRRCIGTGYVGRLGVYELFEMNDQYGELIVRGEPTETLRSAAKSNGMRFLVDDGVEKIRQGLTSVEEIVRIAGRC
ncbi:MAG: type II/IV secretion system protein [Phycisphaerales bacterium]|nr:type II/IV secretion system protein [Phycisphaerales bacterium]MCB9864681.1 type II/IV secretion system protein [Phycisphaerales bacterium]